MYYLTCGIVMLLLSFILFLLLRLTSPLSLAFFFFSFVMLGALSGYLLSNDFLPYMLYLIYVGGLLVLVVYMVIISTNYHFSSLLYKRMMVLAVICCMLMMFLYSNNFLFISILDKSLYSVGGLALSGSALVVLVLFLLYTFMYICESLRLGGRVLKVGH